MGKCIQGYQIVDKIKDGSVGTVWRAVNTKGQLFALKILSEKNAQRPRKVRQFKHEALLTRKLDHRNIIKVFEYHDVNPPFFTMEFFDSENLKYAMWHQPERVHKYEFPILRQIAEALAYIHAQGIIHKDIKPENVLISDKTEVKLIDFSLGQTKMDRFLQFARRTEGTPLYMAPEQVQGLKCDERSDIYSFGVMMYELLAKRPPFLGTTETALLEKHVKEPAPPIRNFVKTLSPDLEAFLAKLLSKKREDRCADMTTVICELSRWEKRDTVIRLRQVEPARPREKSGR